MSEQIFEFRWRDEKTPYFRVIRNGTIYERVLSFGQNFSIEITDNYSCSGYDKGDGWHPCVAGGVPGVRKCEECKKQEGMSAAQYCDGFNTEMFSGEELETLNHPHYLYFALFDEHLVKVGVSGSSRGLLRQIEQGSHFSYIFAEGMWGVPARQMETLIRKNGMIDKVQGSQKSGLLFPEITKEKAEKIFAELLEKHKTAVLTQRPEFEQYFKNPPEFQDFSDAYHLRQAQMVEKPLHETSLETSESLSGTLIAAKGPLLLLETDTERILVQPKKFKGHQVDFAPRPIGLHKKDAFQSALF